MSIDQLPKNLSLLWKACSTFVKGITTGCDPSEGYEHCRQNALDILKICLQKYNVKKKRFSYIYRVVIIVSWIHGITYPEYKDYVYHIIDSWLDGLCDNDYDLIKEVLICISETEQLDWNKILDEEGLIFSCIIDHKPKKKNQQ